MVALTPPTYPLSSSTPSLAPPRAARSTSNTLPFFNATTQTSKSLNMRLQRSFEPAAVLDGLLGAGEVNGINVACAVTRAAKLLVSQQNADDGLGLGGGLEGRLERVIRLCERGLGMEEEIEKRGKKGKNKFRPRSLSNAVWGLAKCSALMGSCSFQEETLQPFLLKLAENLSSHPWPLSGMNGREKTMTLWAYASTFPKAPPTVPSPSFSPSTVLFSSSTSPNHDPAPIHGLFSAAASTLSAPNCTIRDLSTLAWSFATVSHPASCAPSLSFLSAAAAELPSSLPSPVHPRDLSTLCWSVAHLSTRSRRLEEPLLSCLSVSSAMITSSALPLSSLHTSDIVQLAAAYGVGRRDDRDALRMIYQVATGRMAEFRCWEVSHLTWVCARLYLCPSGEDVEDGADFEAFVDKAVEACTDWRGRGGPGSGLEGDEQAAANMAWSLCILKRTDEASVRLVAAALRGAEAMGSIKPEHAHQLWQVYSLMKDSSPKVSSAISPSFASKLEGAWTNEKGRLKKSSERHSEMSKTLTLMGVSHVNEYKEDIDMAIVLTGSGGWSRPRSALPGSSGPPSASTRVALEFDGPDHYTTGPSPRALGHTHLKYRYLSLKGWSVVRVPFFVWDKIPFWASMERQRYLQRLLSTDEEIRFSEKDVSVYRSPKESVWGGKRSSRYD